MSTSPPYLSTKPDEAACDVLMASLSVFISEATGAMPEAKGAIFREALQRGQLHLEITTPPLQIKISANERDQSTRRTFAIVGDDRGKWSSWAKDLLQLLQ
jgi:hypothetical protein